MKKILVPLLAVVMLAVAWNNYSWGGVAIVATGFVMWVLLHFTRITQTLKRAAERPKGWVGSAVMLNAKLKPKVNLLHVIAMTQSLGERLSAENEQPEIWRWTDEGLSHVTCEFNNGRLVKWTLYRPPEADQASP